MGTKVIIGRITEPRGVELLKENQLGLSDEDPVETYLQTDNTLVQLFISNLGLTEQHGDFNCWSIPDPLLYVNTAEAYLPRRDVDMDDLDVHCAEQVLIHVPYPLLSIRRALALDHKTNRFSHYFIRYA